MDVRAERVIPLSPQRVAEYGPIMGLLVKANIRKDLRDLAKRLS
jgi:hypothetical protein